MRNHPAEPRTLLRAAEKHCESEPDFAFESALAALRWMSKGYGYEITNGDVIQAVRFAKNAGRALGLVSPSIRQRINENIGEKSSVSTFVHQWVETALG